MKKINLFWFSKDLRWHDNHGLKKALETNLPILPVFNLNNYDNRSDKNSKVEFILNNIERLNRNSPHNGIIHLFAGKSIEALQTIENHYFVDTIFYNHDYNLNKPTIDKELEDYCKLNNIKLLSFKDRVIFEKGEVLKNDNTPYTIFTPYYKKWLQRFEELEQPIAPYNYTNNNFTSIPNFKNPTLKDLGFKSSGIAFPSRKINLDTIKNYHNTRDLAFLQQGTSKLSVHLSFGTISIRELIKASLPLNDKFINELVWREFYIMILFFFPHTINKSFKTKYDQLEWDNNEHLFELWKNGKTGFPFVDAGMRQLKETNYMHNRLRMVTASFLTKELSIDWRWGEQWFEENLLDYETASNVGGWQWAASCGCDAVPYFRIFNPELQQKKFDPNNSYITTFIPELNTKDYPKPIIDRRIAKDAAMKRYKAIV
ncbi:MAG: deoxyribodipyrimidine photo-lyase [Bacteroidales bacterium]